MPHDPAHAHDVAVVAKSRDVFRSSVADAIAGGLRPAIYGSGWEPFVDPALVVREYVPNDELPVVYSSVGVLLNDHWQTMHEWGFVSNRLFDALACETPVISDDLPEIDELFDGTVLTYRDAGELRELVDSTRSRIRAGARALRAHASSSPARHTFDHRAGRVPRRTPPPRAHAPVVRSAEKSARRIVAADRRTSQPSGRCDDRRPAARTAPATAHAGRRDVPDLPAPRLQRDALEHVSAGVVPR